jgi:hypothetical protein
MTAQKTRPHLLSILHMFAMAGLIVWWSVYFSRHTPARELFRSSDPPAAADHRQTDARLHDRAAGELGARARRAASALAVAGADIAGGLLMLTLFAIATGIYLRRFEIWLHARASGETMTFAGTDLDDKALAANAAKGRAR